MGFSETILDWYAQHGRDLPWRRTRDPYAIWLSEVILQQTRIAQGTAYWERFMARFPDVFALASASEDEVLRLWEGLGYYSRARNLHAAARQIAALGAFPSTLEGILSLKGVGEYTAAAIGSIAFGLPAAVVDGNVYRVLARHFGIATPVGSTAARKEFTSLAQSLLPAGRAGDFNQGMMDFGALQCTPVGAACSGCPLASTCVALASGRVDSLPVRQAPVAVKERFLAYVYFRCGGFTAVRRRPAGDIWQGLWEPYLVEVDGATRSPVGAGDDGDPRVMAERKSVMADLIGHLPAGVQPEALRLVKGGVKHQLTHRTLYVDFYLYESAERPSLPAEYVWIPEADLDRYGKSRLFELLLKAL